MSALILPYGIRFREDSRLEAFPAAEVFVLGAGGKGIRAVFHIDSGATISIAPASDASVLGIDLAAGSRIVIRGVGDERFEGYRHNLRLKIGEGVVIKAPVVLVEHQGIPRILGREGIFPQFGILFDESKHRTAFLRSRTGRRKIDAFCG